MPVRPSAALQRRASIGLPAMVASSAESRLRLQWALAVGRSIPASACLDGLISRYREPHRRYHGLAHVARVADVVDVLLGEVDVADPVAVRLSAFFHDAVYDPRSSTNEADSARLARRQLPPLDVSGAVTTEVARLIMLTGGHLPAGDDDAAGQVLLDADLEVLGAPPNVYATYATGVRVEYSHVDDETWRSGRAAVLRGFLARDHLFHTPLMRRSEPRARSNLSAELAALNG